jgi:hypothetical protein
VRGYDLTRGQGRSCSWHWLILIAAFLPEPVRAQFGAAPEPGPTLPKTTPIDLAAEQIRVWKSADGDQWAILSGQAAILQGVDGVRADRAMVHVHTTNEFGIATRQVEVYAEGRVRRTDAPQEALNSYRTSMTTESNVVLKPYTAKGLLHIEKPPRGYGMIMARAFPALPSQPATPAAAPPSAPTSPPGSLPPLPPALGTTPTAAKPRVSASALVAAAVVPASLSAPKAKPPATAPPPLSSPVASSASPAPAVAASVLPADFPPPGPDATASVLGGPRAPESSGQSQVAPAGPAPSATATNPPPLALGPTTAGAPPVPAQVPIAPIDLNALSEPPKSASSANAPSEPAADAKDPNPAAPESPSMGTVASSKPVEDKTQAKVDPEVKPAQLEGGGGFSSEPRNVPAGPRMPDIDPPPVDLPPLETSPVVPDLSPPASAAPDNRSVVPVPVLPPTDLEPLPGVVPAPATPRRRQGAQADQTPPGIPIMPGTQRVTRIFPRSGNIETLPTTPDGVSILIIRGGVNVVTSSPQTGLVDITADSAVIWRHLSHESRAETRGPEGELTDDARQPMEIYLEGHVIFRQDEQKVAGNGDQKTIHADRLYYDVTHDRWITKIAEVDVFSPGLVAPMKLKAPQIEQYRPPKLQADGTYTLGAELIRADRTVLTGSRFPNPGYKITNRSIDMMKERGEQTNPNTGKAVGNRQDPNSPDEDYWQVDARQNFFFMGPVPVFYWPRIVADPEDLDTPLRMFSYRYNNYFGHQVLLDFNGFKLIDRPRPPGIDTWNIDLDYLSLRGLAAGSEIGWFGKDLFNDIQDPYRRQKGVPPSVTGSYFGYFDIWGLNDHGIDVLGSGPAIITNTRESEIRFGKAGLQRGPSGVPGLPNGVPAFIPFRGRVNVRHMQSFLHEDDDPIEEGDFRLQLEAAYLSDRYFLEEYYKRLFEVGQDQETLAYLIRQRENWAWTVWTEANLQNFYTDTQWLPRLDYYRLGDSLLDNWFTYFGHSGVDYANVHTAVEVNNPFIFAFMPYDPISNTSGPWASGRFYSNHELDLKLNFGNILRIVPYVQGQATGWTEQINGQSIGRIWGAAGARAEIMAWKLYPNAQSELFNVHGINHKINFTADYRDAYSNVPLNRIGVQDDLDDNTYEEVRRYFALTNYAGGLLPPQYDPRFLILRRGISPITGTTDIQASIQMVQLGIHQRLQTKRGPEGRRRIIDFMTLDLETTYFPNAARDNFGKPFGQNTYNWQWFIGDRTSFISYGWFEFFNIGGQPIFNTNVNRKNDPFGLNVVTSGISIIRPPRTNLFIGYTVLDTGPIATSALNASISYWLSPKWYGTFSESYDFGNGIPLASSFSFTRIGADYIMSLGLNVDPQRSAYTFAFELSPRLSPNMRFGSAGGVNQLDTRYAPTQ